MYGLSEFGGVEYSEVAIGGSRNEVVEWGPCESPDGARVDWTGIIISAERLER